MKKSKKYLLIRVHLNFVTALLKNANVNQQTIGGLREE